MTKPKKPPMMRRDEPGKDRHMNRQMRRGIQHRMVFQDQVKARRQAQGLTQRQLADRIGISVEELREDEKAGSTNLAKVFRYAQALGCHPRDLLYPPENWNVSAGLA